MKFRGKLHAALLVFVFAILAFTADAQQGSGVLTGRVMTEDGQPIPHAIVSISGVSGRAKQTTINRESITDDDGKFVVDGLDAIPYLVSAWSPGYVPESDSGAINPFELSKARFVHVGQVVTVKLILGGVITGRVTTDAGEPVIGAPVRAIRVRDETGLSTSADVNYAHLWTRTTDDRGVYRIYGLAPGAYIVAAGGSDPSSARSTPFAGRTIAYHPSSTRDAATLVNVSSGSEATSIDVVYHGDSGFAISGKIRGTPGTTSAITQTATKIFLRSPTRNETIDITTSQANNNQNGYAFYGVPNGEYEVIARNDGRDGGNGLDSTASRVTVKGADVTGVDLTLVPNATVSGVVVVMKSDSDALECQNHRKSYTEEIIVRARRADSADNRRRLLPVTSGYGVGIPNDEGFFTIRDLKPGRHRIELELPNKLWYLKAMAMTGSKPAVNPATGLTVKSGDKLIGLRLTIASGAAMFKGKITAAENTKLPARLHVHLIPAEAGAAEDVLRFAETSAEADGSFTFTHLAPGKYFVFARTIPDSESGDESLRPGASDAAERKELRKEAAASNFVIELKPCQQVVGYAQRLTN